MRTLFDRVPRHSTVAFTRPGVVAGVVAALGALVGLRTAGGTAHWGYAGLLFIGVAFYSGRAGLRRLAAAVVAVFCLGVHAGRTAPRPSVEPIIEALIDRDEPVHFIGRLLEPVERRLAPPRWMSDEPQPRLRLLVRLDAIRDDERWVPVSARAVVGGADVALEAGAGDAVEGRLRLLRPQAPKNPGEEDSRPRLARAGVSYVGALERGAIVPLSAPSGAARQAERFRARYSAFLHDTLDSPERAALIAALSIGERGGITPELQTAFNASGLAHVLSISGLHLTVAVAAFAWVLWRALALSNTLSEVVAPRRLAAFIAIPLTAGYVVLIGAPPSAVRAAIGTGLALLAVALGRRAEGYSTLGWCLAAVSLADPTALELVSTQLSFLGVLGLIHLLPRLRELVPLPPPDAESGRLRRVGEAALQLGLGSFAATLATAPITALYFERTSLVAALANLASWPASTLIVPAGALSAGLFALAQDAAAPFVHIAGACAWALVAFARLFAALPFASVTVAPPSAWALTAYYLLLFSAFELKRTPARVVKFVACASALALLVAAWPVDMRTNDTLRITFLAVGQGDGAVVRFPNGSTMVVDSGGEVSGRFDPGARIVTPFLRYEGVRRIDRLVASHPHPDHVGGMPALFERFPVGELWHNGDGATDGRALSRLLPLAISYGTRLVDFRSPMPERCPALPALEDVDALVASLAVGDPRCAPLPPHIDIDGVRVEVLHPLGGPYGGSFPELGENDNSLVLRLVHGNVRILLPGDIEKEGEALLVARGVDLSANLIKAPHHGSRTSSTEAFLRRVAPSDVVFCVGENNQFGFPAPEVVDRYARLNVRAHRTDRNAVTFVSDGDTLRRITP